MVFENLELTTALRPLLIQDETLLCVQDGVGLYEGKLRIPELQDGQTYLTTHRVCYVDKVQARKHSFAIALRHIERCEISGRFLKSSPKVALYPKPSKQSSLQPFLRDKTHQNDRDTANGSPLSHLEAQYGPGVLQSAGQSTNKGTWICTICSFSNPIPTNFDPSTANAQFPFSPCQACGIPPKFAHVLKAAIANAAGRGNQKSDASALGPHAPPAGPPQESAAGSLAPSSTIQCPRCTFSNHDSMTTCEICGSPLRSSRTELTNDLFGSKNASPSPGPSPQFSSTPTEDEFGSIKLSFRGGGEKLFYERLKGALVQRKWLLQSAPPIPDPISRPLSGAKTSLSTGEGNARSEPSNVVGIAGLERRRLEIRRKNEEVIGTAFEDLDALMASAKEIIALAEQFAKEQGAEGDDFMANDMIASSFDMTATRDTLASNNSDESLYITELARNLAEYLTDDKKGILKREGGIMSLVDLWAFFNRARGGGAELVSPHDFEKAAQLWEKLKLPVRLRHFKNGLRVVQQADRTDDKTIAELLAFLDELHALSVRDPDDVLAQSAAGALSEIDTEQFGVGVTAQEAARRFGWSIGVATEELEMAEERGVLCREESVEGVRFWQNWIVQYQDLGQGVDGITVMAQSSSGGAPAAKQAGGDNDHRVVMHNLREIGLV